MNLTKLQRPFYTIKETDFVVTKPITNINESNLEDTIFSSKLDIDCGYIKLKEGMQLYNYFLAKKKDRNFPIYNVQPSYAKNKTEVYKVNKNEYLRVPKSINKVFKLDNGLRIMTGLQRAYNNILIENNTIRTKDENITYQNLYTNLLIEFNELLVSKGGLYDRAVTSLWPYSCRCTISNGPNLKINEVSLPYKVLIDWVNKDEVRKAFNIDENLSCKDAVRFLENKRVICLRQPVHDRSNVMSFIIKLGFNDSFGVVKINPVVHHLLDSDVDGDAWVIFLPLNKESQQDLIKMDVFNFICENSEHFKPGKEFKKYQPEQGWATNNFDILNMQIKHVAKQSTNGLSISYHDLVNDGKEDGYFNNTNVNREELKKIALGITQNDLMSDDDSFSISGAVRSYKLIKQNVAQFGALSNAFVALLINNTWDIEPKLQQECLDKITMFKHILCQDGLSAKHGSNKLNADTGKILQDMFYNTPDNKLKTLEEYKMILKDINIPEDIIKLVMNSFWHEPITGINKILNDIVPTYRITRRNTDIGLLDNMCNINNEKSIQAEMII